MWTICKLVGAISQKEESLVRDCSVIALIKKIYTKNNNKKNLERLVIQRVLLVPATNFEEAELFISDYNHFTVSFIYTEFFYSDNSDFFITVFGSFETPLNMFAAEFVIELHKNSVNVDEQVLANALNEISSRSSGTKAQICKMRTKA